MSLLYSQILKVSDLTHTQKDQMYSIMECYYDSVTKDQFLFDLSKKSKVILLRDSKQRNIQGFSTLLDVSFECDGKRICGVYSGDTIVKKQYWGQSTLGKAFSKYVWMQKMKNPFRKYYWFLISKGYKTYLLMANNFETYFPRYETETPDFYRNVMNRFYGDLFPDHYCSKSGIIRFEKAPCKLKTGIAEINSQLIAQYPRIAFFQNTNPEWNQGAELTCIGEVSFYLPFKVAAKAVLRKFKFPGTSKSFGEKRRTA